MPQLFHKGDLVHIAKNLGSDMSHFESDVDAIVIGSYQDRYGGREESTNPNYTVFIRGQGQVSWYYQSQLTLCPGGKNRLDILKWWQDELDAEHLEKSNLDWIFEHGADVLKKPHGASIAALAKCFTNASLWGAHGEGVDYYKNAQLTLRLAAPFLAAGQKDAWLAYCEKELKPLAVPI